LVFVFHRVSSFLSRTSALAATAIVFTMMPVLQGQVPVQIELEEARIALSSAQEKVRKLQEALVNSEKLQSAVADSLAVANAEANQYRETYQSLRVQLEGLGVSLLDDKNGRGLEKRLLEVLSDLKVTRDENQLGRSLLGKLKEGCIAFAQTAISSDVNARAALEEQLRATDNFLVGVQPPGLETSSGPSSIQDSRVVSTKDDFHLAVLNVGSHHGVKVGMPFQLYRKDKPLGRVIVVDVRDSICGAVYQESLDKSGLKIGDIAKVDSAQ